MAKTMRWQVPFQSLKGIDYTVNIYDEGYTGTPVELTPATQPFTTDEDNSEDFFYPVRGQNGTLRVIDADGTLLSSIIPQNNTSRPVTITREEEIDAGGGMTQIVDVIQWQGFLSCEGYSQTYQSTAQPVEIALQSVLQAMDSIQADTDTFNGLMSIRDIIAACIVKVNDYGAEISGVKINKIDFLVLGNLVNASLFFEQKEQSNEYNTVYLANGKSLKSVLEIICTFMGWCVREKGQILYFQRIGSKTGYISLSLSDLQDTSKLLIQFVSNTTGQLISAMSSYEYRGANHTIAFDGGAKSVEVVADTSRETLDISIPDSPDTRIIEKSTQYAELLKGSTSVREGKYIYLYASRDVNVYSNIQCKQYAAMCRPYYAYAEQVQQSTVAIVLANSATAGNSPIQNFLNDSTALTKYYAGACFCKEGIDSIQNNAQYNPSNGIHCVFFPGMIESTYTAGLSNFPTDKIDYIFRISTIQDIIVSAGYFKISMDAITHYLTESGEFYEGSGRDIYVKNDWNPVLPSTRGDYYATILLKFRVGDQWWNGSTWVSQETYFETQLEGSNFKKTWNEKMELAETDGIVIPKPGMSTGSVELQILNISNRKVTGRLILEMFIRSLNVTFIEKGVKLNVRSENHYFKILNTNFSDEISIDSELATNMNNRESPHIIRESKTKASSSVSYYVPNTDKYEERRPEKDLLERLATFYQTSRRRISLEVAQLKSALPVMRVIGYDNQEYSPMAESRDWESETSTIMFIETPDMD